MARAVRPAAARSVPEKALPEKMIALSIVIIPFLGTLCAIVLLWNRWVGWLDLALMLGLYLFSGLGMTIGFHRMLTHKSFEAKPWLRRLLLVAGCTAAEGDPIGWASRHIQHHAHANSEEQAHRLFEGLWTARTGWLFGHKHNTDIYGTWLKKDPDAVWVSKTWGLWVALGFTVPLAIGGISGLMWGGFVRVFLTHHITWSVNAICHRFGSRDYQTRDTSRNNFMVGLLVFGEGWHNNHHAFPRSAFHGLHWWQVDLSGSLIRVLERMGLVWNVVRVTAEDMQRRGIQVHAKMGD